MTEARLRVRGYPPAKGEALSMLGAKHSHAPRVRRLLEAAREQLSGVALGSGPIGIEMMLRCPRDGNRGDATNYLGGVADVLESKTHRGMLEHLGDLALVYVYDNDRQIEELHYRWEQGTEPSYELRVSTLER